MFVSWSHSCWGATFFLHPLLLAEVMRLLVLFGAFACLAFAGGQSAFGQGREMLEKAGLRRNEDGDVVSLPKDGGGRLFKSSPTEAPNVWKSDGALDCGPNSLYVFLSLHRFVAPIQEVRDRVNVGDRGASMLELKNVAKDFGCEVEIVEGDLKSLADHLPAIARVATVGSAEEFAHYVVLVRYSEDEDGDIVSLIDGTSGVSIEVPAPVFNSEFSGHAIIRRQQPVIASLSLNGLLMFVVALQVFAIVFFCGRKILT